MYLDYELIAANEREAANEEHKDEMASAEQEGGNEANDE